MITAPARNDAPGPGIRPTRRGLSIIQSKIAIGSGGLRGKGWLPALSHSLNFSPNAILTLSSRTGGRAGISGHSDSARSLHSAIMRGLWIAARAQTTFGRVMVAA